MKIWYAVSSRLSAKSLTSTGCTARKRSKKILLIVAETPQWKENVLKILTYERKRKCIKIKLREMFLKVFIMNSAIICNITIHGQKSIIHLWTLTFATCCREMTTLNTLTTATHQKLLSSARGVNFCFRIVGCIYSCMNYILSDFNTLVLL